MFKQVQYQSKHLPDSLVLEIFNADGTNTEIAERYSNKRNGFVSRDRVASIKIGRTYSQITGKVYEKGS